MKPEIVIKAGAIAWAQMGDPNASIPTPQPIHMRPMFGSYGGAIAATSLTFVSQAALEAGAPESINLQHQVAAGANTRRMARRI